LREPETENIYELFLVGLMMFSQQHSLCNAKPI